MMGSSNGLCGSVWATDVDLSVRGVAGVALLEELKIQRTEENSACRPEQAACIVAMLRTAF